MSDVLEQLAEILEHRREGDPQESYVASLHHKGLNKILEKVGEEATEVILAARDVDQGADSKIVVGEVADLWFHTLVMLSHLDLDACAVLECLEDRFGVSGIDEKTARDEGNK